MIKKYQNIQGLRGLAVLAVVLFHLGGMEHFFLSGRALLPNFFNYGFSGVDLFFVISGFIMVMVTRSQSGGSAARHFLYHRVTRIYPLYWFYALLLWLLHFLLIRQPINPEVSSWGYILKCLLLCPQKASPFLPVAWTLIHEMYFYLMVAAILCLPIKKSFIGWTLWIVALIIGNFILHTQHITSPVWTLILHPLTFEFLLGCGVAFLIYSNVTHYPRIILGIGLITLVLGSWLSYRDFTLDPDAIQFWSRVITFGIPAACLVYALSVFELRQRILPRFLRTIGDHSYSIYLSHVLVLSFCVKVFTKLHMNNFITHAGFIIAALIGILLVGKFSYEFLEKPTIEFCRKWWQKRQAYSQNLMGKIQS